MNQMSQEIIDCMSGLTERDEQVLSAQFVFPKEFVGFRGHFDNNPILPGICIIRAVIVMCEKHYNKAFRLKEVISAKYVAPVTCAQKITVVCNLTTNKSSSVNVQAVIEDEKKKVAMLKLYLENQSG
ncbi:MAG: hypothetical protein NUV86_00345 [Candidatus Scalindua sp.]|nr:hypothetical protein [Candidatus Scalindua sp.]MCR4344666.1 hypothetical protein [Candidatus Scalindua sp.]